MRQNRVNICKVARIAAIPHLKESLRRLFFRLEFRIIRCHLYPNNMTVEERITKFMEQGGSALAFFSGIWHWMGDNQPAIASFGVFFGIAIGVAGFILSWHYKREQTKILERKAWHE